MKASEIFTKCISDYSIMDFETIDGLKKLATDYPFCQSIQQLYLLNLKILGNKVYEKELAKVAIRICNRDILQRELIVLEKIHFPPVFKSKNTPKKKNRLEKSEKLLDKFIESNPSISRLKDNEEENLPEILNGNFFTEGVVSETLAEIYLKKGLKEEAKAVYLKLAEDFPDKKEYFLERIESLS